ncbi:MAG: winged helix-turn-helix transcriptional regulator [Chloroflexi bacterium]|nr:MAG: winged helix-turn-helix transcriptional regulator [Chloroflexota bacterium]
MPAHVDGTREEILAILRRRERVGVEDLAAELGLAGATVRRHLDVLQRDNYVSVTQVRGHTGRPRHLFELTEAGADLFPHHYVRLTQRLLGEIVGLDASETAGRSGGDIAALVFEKMADRLATEYAPMITGDTLEARVRSAVRLIGEEGIDFEVLPRDGVVRLLGRGCPCTRLTGGKVGSCDHDRQMLERLLGARVESLPAAEVPHDFHCGYLVTPA